MFRSLVEATTLIEVLQTQASHRPHHMAYRFLHDDGATELTYAELDSQARVLAAWLQAHHPKGERVLLLFPPGLGFIAAFFGCLYAGAIPVPAYPPKRNRHGARLQAILESAQPRFILYAEVLTKAVTHFLRRLPSPSDSMVVPLEEVWASSPGNWNVPRVQRDDVAMLQYTSGTLAQPKGVALSHANILENMRLIHQAFLHTTKSRGLIWLPPYHDMGLMGGILQPLYVGFPVTLMAPTDFLRHPLRWLKAISETQATTSGGPNFAYDLCVRTFTPEAMDGVNLESWEVAFNGAEMVQAATLDRFVQTFKPYGFRRKTFLACYGLAESTLFVSGGHKLRAPYSLPVNDHQLKQRRLVPCDDQTSGMRRLVSVGRPSTQSPISIVDPDTRVRCSPHTIGEVWLAGPSVAHGYWQQAETTEETFQAFLQDTGEGPFLRTGDLGFMWKGHLFITGRLKELIIVHGRNHYPQDIERTVEHSHDGLRPGHGAAFALPTPDGDQLVVVQEVKRTALRTLQPAHVIEAIRCAISDEHELAVEAVVLIRPASLSKTPSGKTRRLACQTHFLESTLHEVARWQRAPNVPTPPTVSLSWSANKSVERVPLLASDHQSPWELERAIQRWLIERLATALHVASETINPDQHFGYYGLDSVVATQIAAELSEWLGVPLDTIVMWDYPNVNTLSEHLVTILHAPTAEDVAVTSIGSH